MQMRRRLKTIASLVDKGSKVIDVGCDHALLDIYLTLYNGNRCIASDINKNAYEIAKSNIEKYRLGDEIELIQSDGFNKIEMSGNYTAIICGMGTTTILDILKSPKLKMIDTLIIQTNNDISLSHPQLNNDTNQHNQHVVFLQYLVNNIQVHNQHSILQAWFLLNILIQQVYLTDYPLYPLTQDSNIEHPLVLLYNRYQIDYIHFPYNHS